MKELDSMLDSNTTEAEIKAALNKVCSMLLTSIKTEVSCVYFRHMHSRVLPRQILKLGGWAWFGEVFVISFPLQECAEKA